MKRENTVKFTDSAVSSWKPREKQFEMWELSGKGFGLRISPGGTKNFIFIYRFHGRQRRMSLGTYPETSLAQAHVLHAEARFKLQEGIDPATEKRATPLVNSQAVTFQELAELYIEEHSKLEKKTWKEDSRKLNFLLPAFGARAATEIQPVELSDFVQKIKREAQTKGGTGKIAADFLNLVSRIYKHAIQRGRATENPCRDLAIPVKSGVRKRYMNGEEIGIFWNKLQHTTMMKQTQLIFKLLLCTGQRKSDVLQIEKADLNLKTHWWNIPQSKTKNGEPHKVHLNDLALKIIRAALELSGSSNWLFPGDGSTGHQTPRCLNRALNNVQSAFGFEEELQPHDLRRSVATHLSKDKRVGRFITNRILNHKDVDALQNLAVMEHYDGNEYLEEIQAALEVWNELLEGYINKNKFKRPSPISN